VCHAARRTNTAAPREDKFQGGQKGGHKGEGGRLDLAMMPCSSPPTGATKGNGRGNCFVSLLSP
jgi:hypothetical protein